MSIPPPISTPKKDLNSKRILAALEEARSRLEEVERARYEPIAIVGIGCRFPGEANDLDSFWQLLVTGRDTTGKPPASRWDPEDYYDSDSTKPGKLYVRDGTFLNGIEDFDADFFGISGREALSLDPQQRILLEVSWEALEDAGIQPSSLEGSPTGVFVGITCNDYARRLMKTGLTWIDAHFLTGNALNAAAGRISYLLRLQGPSLAVDTACSSSLVAIHLACQSLRAGESRAALAGGVNLILSPESSIAACKAQMLSPDARCKTFDAEANGFGRGEGCGMIVLKRLSDALADGDIPHALIRGSAVNQDGASSGFTVPNGTAQRKLIAQALSAARLQPNQVSYLETHGTGTALGDPIEYRAAVTSYSINRSRPLILGAVKANIGHLESAAGVAGLIKAVLVLEHRAVPAQLHFLTPNPLIPFKELPSIIPQSLFPLDESDRFAAVSSFGASGTNAHIIFEAWTPPDVDNLPPGSHRPRQLLALSAKTAGALDSLAGAYAKLVEQNRKLPLADLCSSAVTTREHFRHRLAILAADSSDLAHKLKDFIGRNNNPSIFYGCCDREPVLKESSPSIRQPAADAQAAEWEQFLTQQAAAYIQGGSLSLPAEKRGSRKVRLPSYPWQRQRFWPDTEDPNLRQPPSDTTSDGKIDQWFYQPEWQIEPIQPPKELRCRFPSPEALKQSLLTSVAAIQQDPEIGAYWDFIRSLEQVSTVYILDALEILGWSWREGDSQILDEFIRKTGIQDSYRRLTRRLLQILQEDGILNCSGDSWTVASADKINTARDPRKFAISADRISSPEFQLLVRCGSQLASVLTGRCEPLSLLFPGTGISAAHLYGESVGAQAMNSLMRDTIQQLIESGTAGRELRVLEIGAGTGGTTRHLLPLFPADSTRYTITDVTRLLVNQARDSFSQHRFLDFRTLDIEQPPLSQGFEPHTYDLVIAANVIHATRDIGTSVQHARQLLKSGGILALLELTAPLRFVDLIFGLTDGWWRFADSQLRQDHALISIDTWESVLTTNGFSQCSAVGSVDPSDDLLSKQGLIIAQADAGTEVYVESEPERWLFLADQSGLADQAIECLRTGSKSVAVERIENGRKKGSHELSLGNLDHIRRSLTGIRTGSFAGIVHFWSCDVLFEESADTAALMKECELSTRTALDLMQPLLAGDERPPFWFVTRGAAPVSTPHIAGLPQSLVWGMFRAAALEYPRWRFAGIDLPGDCSQAPINALVDELRYNTNEREVALREQRWVNRLVRSNISTQARFSIRHDSTYLIVGGSRGLGPAAAQWLAEQGARHLALISRTPPDGKANLAINAARDTGCEVALLTADVTKENELRDVLTTIRSGMPPLRGVIHSAGALADGLLPQQNWRQFCQVLEPKIRGAWNLHRLTSGAPLDFFVMFSSIASLFGSPGQTNHAAANAFLDLLAHYRRGHGLPGLSINWGAWSEIGSAARQQVSDRLYHTGLGGIPTKLGLKALERCMGSSLTQVGITPIDWSRFLYQFSVDRRETWLNTFLPAAALTGVDRRSKEAFGTDTSLDRLRETQQEGWSDLLRAYVEHRLREILRIAPTRTVASDDPLNEMGMDSLIGTELKNRFTAELKVDVSLKKLIGGATVSDVVREIAEQLAVANLANKNSPDKPATLEMEEITL
jgi:3-oxoacyl-(acyl-carrier-protein) synthase/SAM-dependent methyltransferase